MKQGMEPMIEALSQDNLKEEEQLLFCYFSKYYPLESDKRISKVTIENGFLKPVILIETRDLNGMSSIIREPYKRNITKAKKKKRSIGSIFIPNDGKTIYILSKRSGIIRTSTG